MRAGYVSEGIWTTGKRRRFDRIDGRWSGVDAGHRWRDGMVDSLERTSWMRPHGESISRTEGCRAGRNMSKNTEIARKFKGRGHRVDDLLSDKNWTVADFITCTVLLYGLWLVKLISIKQLSDIG